MVVKFMLLLINWFEEIEMEYVKLLVGWVINKLINLIRNK